MAARLRRELGIDVEQVHGRYGEYKVLVDGAVVVDAGRKAAFGLMPSGADVVRRVRDALARAGG